MVWRAMWGGGCCGIEGDVMSKGHGSGRRRNEYGSGSGGVVHNAECHVLRGEGGGRGCNFRVEGHE